MRVLSLQVHGLLKSSRNEFGRNPDTGGQTLYVLELAKALGRKGVSVDLVTRLIDSPEYDPYYSLPLEEIPDSDGRARIVRLEYGPKERFVPKEQLWEYLPQLVSAGRKFYGRQNNGVQDRFSASDGNSYPDIIHSHYADAGLVGMSLKRSFLSPLIHTTHSLGFTKLQKFLQEGCSIEQLNFPLRLGAEARLILNADAIVTNTKYEKYKWANYAFPNFSPELSKLIGDVYLIDELDRVSIGQVPFSVIPPGVDSRRFFPEFTDTDSRSLEGIIQKMDTQLQRPEKKLILSVGRIDPTKNVLALIRAYLNSDLKDSANLLIAGGSPEFKSAAETLLSGSTFSTAKTSSYEASVLNYVGENLPALKGRIAFLGFVDPEKEVAPLYRYAAKLDGVFVNTNLYESFGFTVIEAMACGLLTCATKNGGPSEILIPGLNGYLLDPVSIPSIANTLRQAFSLNGSRESIVRNASRLVHRKYTWSSVAEQYIQLYESKMSVCSPKKKSFHQSCLPVQGAYSVVS